MSKAMQLLGSKISLISKSEIRYEGILFTLNPNESTLALAKVRMFGTENRSTDNPVAPREEVFEFIIFRGQDIKDIRLCEPPTPQPPLPGTLPYDPAIVQHSVPAVGVLGNSGIQQPAGMSGNILRPSFGPIGGMNPYPNLVGGDNGASGAALGQLGNNMIPGLSASLGGLGLSGAAAVAAASELPLSPHGDVPPHPDQLTDASGLGDQGTRLSPDKHIVTCFSWLFESFQLLHAFAAFLLFLHVPTVYQLCLCLYLYLWGFIDAVCSDWCIHFCFTIIRLCYAFC